MQFDVDKIVPGSGFTVEGASYIGKPITRTAMYITNKVSHLLKHLESVEKCLVFAESGMDVPDQLLKNHSFVFTDNPQLAYAEFAQQFQREKIQSEMQIKYLYKDGYYVSESASIGKGAYIEPGCLIGHGVMIGDDAQIMAGSIIKNAKIGSSFLCNEQALIGSNGFTMATDQNGNKLRIPTLGGVVIGDNVEVGAHDNISCGSSGNTIIEDYVKIDALVHIGHDVHLEKNVEITAGVIVGGFCTLGEDTYAGVNSCLKNRRTIGSNVTIGMGTTVIRDIPDNTVMVGNPAHELKKD